MENEQNQISPIVEPQMPAQPASQPVSEPKLKLKKPLPKLKIAALIVLLILVLTVPFGGYLLLGKMGIHPKPSTVTIKTVASVAIPTPTPDPFTGWQTYAKDFLDQTFSIRYPANFYFTKGGGTQGVNYIGDSKNSVDGTYLAGKSLQNNQIVISLLPLEAETDSLQKIANQISGTPQIDVLYTPITVAGYPAVKIVDNNIESYGILGNGRAFSISAQPASSTLEQIFQTMLSTIKFASQSAQAIATDTANWTTHVNRQYNYSVKYPANIFAQGTFENFRINSTDSETLPDWTVGIDINTSIFKASDQGCKYNCYTVENSKDTAIDNNFAAKRIEGYYTTTAGIQRFQKIVFQRNNYFYEITLWGPEKESLQPLSSGSIKIFDQILSTFKFTQ